MRKVLEVKDLRVSFRTNNGNVKAVRGISFDLNEGETLAIVGESGSGKSVTAKSIIGINAANTIIEGGEIIYKGEDLLKYSEKDYNKVRGNALTMVFQDPLSSLDPIMKVGKQMTEATLLNNKTRRKNARAELKQMQRNLRTYMRKAGCSDTQIQQDNIAKALQASDERARAAKKTAADAIAAERPVFEQMPLDEKAARAAAKRLTKLVKVSIDPLALEKNSGAYTFGTSMNMNLDRYFTGLRNNPKEEKRVNRESAKRERALQQKKHPPKVVPANLIDLELTVGNLRKTMTELEENYKSELSRQEKKDYRALASAMLAYLEEKKTESVTKVTKKEAYDRAIKIMTDVGIKESERRFNQYPHEFSGGMRQRIVIAIAIAANPEILLCDEPTTALDVTIQAQILELINEVKARLNISVLFITHDLGVVANMADKVAVMYAGKIVEYGTVEDIFYDPKHPYTWALLSSMPSLDAKDKLKAIPGTPPNMIYPPKGDAFAERNQYAMKIDFERQPPFFKVSDMLQTARPSEYEYQWVADYAHHVARAGMREAFPTIAAAGSNATMLHYCDNNCIAPNGALFLFDLGAEYGYYSSDVSRTFPVNGKFTDRQKELFCIVRDAQDAARDKMRPGVEMKQANQAVIDFYKKALRAAKLIRDDSEVSKYYYHGVSHSLGLDTHDPCDRTVYEPGMVITCEPGLYVAEEGIGIRLENDILVTENEPEDLIGDRLLDIAEIEAIMG